MSLDWVLQLHTIGETEMLVFILKMDKILQVISMMLGVF